MNIEVRFGKITIDNKEFHDIIILPSGKLIERDYKNIEARYGTSHVIDENEIEILLKENPKTIVIGTGFEGIAKLTDKARENILKNKIKLIEKKTPEAVKTFLTLKGKKAGLFHSTC